MRLLLEHFPKILDVEFTAKMEDELDSIEEGEIGYLSVLNDFYIPLPYGEDTDWCLNVLAAGACTVHWNGQTYQLSLPQIVGRAVGEIVYAPMYRILLHASGVKKYLQAKQVPG